MILSYAQNMEDVVLEAVFADDPLTRDGGIYIDIGGGHAVADNVTFALYLAGWRGVVVEPQPRLAAPYANTRPRDVVVSALVGRVAGEADFHEVERFHGFSTMVARHADRAAGFGTHYTTRKMPVTTLAALCEAHGLGEGAGLSRIDLLKIDVEGAEADVLAGNDWARFRPRVACIEAVQPGSMEAAWGAWEPALLAQGYRFAHFDGLNRFYVAQEAAALLARFPKAQPDWASVAHLYDFGPPLRAGGHADHRLAQKLAEGFLALLPTLDPRLIAAALKQSLGGQTPEVIRATLLGERAKTDPPRAPLPPPSDEAQAEIAALLEHDALRAALARIACFHDGGHLIEMEASPEP